MRRTRQPDVSLNSSCDVVEVFSRSQDPQDWSIAKRLVPSDWTKDEHLDYSTKGKVYMEIGRKEATLSDAERELAGVVRRFTEM